MTVMGAGTFSKTGATCTLSKDGIGKAGAGTLSKVAGLLFIQPSGDHLGEGEGEGNGADEDVDIAVDIDLLIRIGSSSEGALLMVLVSVGLILSKSVGALLKVCSIIGRSFDTCSNDVFDDRTDDGTCVRTGTGTGTAGTCAGTCTASTLGNANDMCEFLNIIIPNMTAPKRPRPAAMIALLI